MKSCSVCKETKPEAAFNKRRDSSDGLRAYCKKCHYGYTRRWQQRNYLTERARLRAIGIRNGKADKNRIYLLRNQDKKADYLVRHNIWRSQNRDITAANRLVARALKDGVLTKQPCTLCGCALATEGHHQDYNRPLDIQWLCKKHHRAWHRVFLPDRGLPETKEG